MAVTIGPPTARQQEIFGFIKFFIAAQGYPPSLREIGVGVGLSSSSTVHHHVAELERKGLIRRRLYSMRTICVREEAS